MTNTSATSAIIAVISIAVTILLAQILVPALMYEYVPTLKGIQIWNIGLSPATDVLIEIIPNNGIVINGVSHSTIEGESIIDYSKDSRLIFHIHHIYPKDRLTFTLETDQNLSKEDIEIIIRANEGEGFDAAGFFKDFYSYAQLGIFLASIALGVRIFFTLNPLLDKIIRKTQ